MNCIRHILCGDVIVAMTEEPATWRLPAPGVVPPAASEFEAAIAKLRS